MAEKLTGAARQSALAKLNGWSEVLVVVRFWIIQGMCMAVGLGLFYAGFVAAK